MSKTCACDTGCPWTSGQQKVQFSRNLIKMASSWMFCVVVFLWCSTQLQTVWAGEKVISKQLLEDWVEVSGSNGKVVDEWLYSTRNKWINTDVSPGGASWFITPPLNLPNTSYLEIEATCSNNPCQLEIYGTNGLSLARSSKNFEFIRNVTFERRRVNTATVKKSYPHLRILARTSSTSSETTFYIYSIKIRYYFCEKTTIYNTDLAQVYSSTKNISKLFQCHDNAIASDGKSRNITVKCTPKGNWTFGDHKCVCDRGFHFNNQSCSQCPTNYYKTTIGDELCDKCPYGTTNNTMHTQCGCKEDHYVGNDEDGPCYVVPSAVEEINIQILTSTSVNITWIKPKDDGGFNGSLRYSVECYHCVNGSECDTIVKNAIFFPAKTDLGTNFVVISNLTFNKKYKFKIISMNGLKNVPTGKWKFREKIAVVETVTRTNPETKFECEVKTCNSIAMFFTGVGVTLATVLFILIVIVIYKRRVKDAKESRNVGAVRGTIEMQGHALAGTGPGQSQHNQGLDHDDSIDSGTAPHEVVSPPAIYAELNRNQQDETENTYQKLLKHDLGYALPVNDELEASYEEVENKKTPSNYQELDSTKRVLDDSASYQKLTKFQRPV